MPLGFPESREVAIFSLVPALFGTKYMTSAASRNLQQRLVYHSIFYPQLKYKPKAVRYRATFARINLQWDALALAVPIPFVIWDCGIASWIHSHFLGMYPGDNPELSQVALESFEGALEVAVVFGAVRVADQGIA